MAQRMGRGKREYLLTAASKVPGGAAMRAASGGPRGFAGGVIHGGGGGLFHNRAASGVLRGFAGGVVRGPGGGLLRRTAGPGRLFTRGVASVTKYMPQAAKVGPDLFLKNIPLVSGVTPLVSEEPLVSAPVYFGIVPTRTAEDIPRKRDVPPSEMGALKFLLGYVVGAPLVLPVKMVEKIAEEVRAQAEEESGESSRLRGRLLENAMRYEAGQITEEAYRAREAEFRASLDRLKEEGSAE